MVSKLFYCSLLGNVNYYFEGYSSEPMSLPMYISKHMYYSFNCVYLCVGYVRVHL